MDSGGGEGNQRERRVEWGRRPQRKRVEVGRRPERKESGGGGEDQKKMRVEVG